MRRFFVPPGTLDRKEVELPAELARRLATVLRLNSGDRVVLTDGGGRDCEVELRRLSPRAASGAIVAERASPVEPAVELTLYQSLIRPQRFELVLEKGTELGVARFVPLQTGRAQVKTREQSQRMQRWRRIVTEAAEQSGRGRVPVVEPPQPLAEALASAPGLRLLPWEGAVGGQGLTARLRSVEPPPGVVSLFVGPEGGFAEDEVEAARRAGCVPVSLGRRILRSETAGIVAAALVMHELGEMG